ncbi:anoctamin-1 isoform X3 [Procambarus clarkii]|uniref:anoctamin-1 isoform X3 n=1 Tax=Procambarus clarkii TaxID=6728 RepID=UPI00374279A8
MYQDNKFQCPTTTFNFHIANPFRFVKVHAPYDVCARYAELLHLSLPMKQEVYVPYTRSPNPLAVGAPLSSITKLPLPASTFPLGVCVGAPNSSTIKNKVLKYVEPDVSVSVPTTKTCTAIFSLNKKYLFTGGELTFPPSVRLQVLDFILGKKFESDSPHEFGIEDLISGGVYEAAYPIHQGGVGEEDSRLSLLYIHWAALTNLLKTQPLDAIKEYFGVKVALYFAWLGFYTYMLLPAAVVGVLCFLYGLATLHGHQPSSDICEVMQNVTMCPLCDLHCQHWKLAKACQPARLTYLVDNPATIFFTAFMALWARIFLKLWKRYSAEITRRWDAADFDMKETAPRPAFLAYMTRTDSGSNSLSDTSELRLPFCSTRLPRFIVSVSTVLLLVVIAIGAVMGVIIYRMSVFASPLFASQDPFVFSSVTASLINLVCITLINEIYTRVAVTLTEWELHRTQAQHDDSLTLKMYLLQFVNYYSSIFYVAFFKGRWAGYPGAYNHVLGYRQEECGPGGCLMELTVQLATIMIGRQAINACIEMGLPILRRWCNRMTLHSPRQPYDPCWPQWAKDFYLMPFDARSLFYEYLEMVLQFGFVTIFVASFPLAPLFALVNNMLETRLDARKFVTFYRRPAPLRVNDIGVWFHIMDTVSKLAVVSNSFIIAFTSNFIPETVYRYTVSSNGSLEGYVEDSLATFTLPRSNHTTDLLQCRYRAYLVASEELGTYEYTPLYWRILTARLAFIVIFQNLVLSITTMVDWIIADVPDALKVSHYSLFIANVPYPPPGYKGSTLITLILHERDLFNVT